MKVWYQPEEISERESMGESRNGLKLIIEGQKWTIFIFSGQKMFQFSTQVNKIWYKLLTAFI